MEKEEIQAVDAMMREMTNLAWTSSQVIRHLSQNAVVTQEEKKELLRIDRRPLRTKKIMNLLKRKPNGFFALKRALMVEKTHNKHLVDKLDAKHKKFIQNPGSGVKPKPKIKEKLSPTELMHVYTRLMTLVWGKNSKQIDDANFEKFEQVLDELESNRDTLYDKEEKDEFRSLFTLIMELKEENQVYCDNEKDMREEMKKMKRKLRDVEAKNDELEVKITDMQLSREEEVNRRIEEVRRRLLRSGLDDPDEDFFSNVGIKYNHNEEDELHEGESDNGEMNEEDSHEILSELTVESSTMESRRVSKDSGASSVFINNRNMTSQNVILIKKPRNVNIFN